MHLIVLFCYWYPADHNYIALNYSFLQEIKGDYIVMYNVYFILSL